MNQTRPAGQTSDEIDLRELFSYIWRGKLSICITVIVFAVVSVFYALSLPDVYKSEALLAPVSENSKLNVPGQLGGLAALAGVNIGGGGSEKAALAIEILKSREFIGRFIEENDLYITLMATEGWSRVDDSLIIDSSIYDDELKQWIRKVKLPFKPKPSTQETVEKFKKIYSVSQDKLTGMVTITIEFYSPFIAKNWLDKIIELINEEMRQRDLVEAEQSIMYLNQKVAETNVSDLRTTLYSLIEEQTKTAMLANVRKQYIFKTVDPALVAEKKNGPKRAFIVLVSVFLGLFISIFTVIIRCSAIKRDSN